MITIADKNKCSGCTACYSICPFNAIKMEIDEEGFLYPLVDKTICTNCKKCEKICPIINHKENEIDLKEAFAAKNINIHDREMSSSGGIFIALARKVLKNNGLVFGCALDDNFLAHHIMINSEKELPHIVGSKYMESNLETTFRIIKKFLNNNQTILFCGTTCQISGLKSFLEHDYEKLICVDFICLGVPSPKIWKAYLNTFFDINEIKNINFKDKTNGWHTFSLRISKKNNPDFLEIGAKTFFFSGYFKGLYSRPSCNNCICKGDNNRISDITLSDCWGIENIAPEFDDNKGVSCIICHSTKGLKLFNSISKELIYKKIDLLNIKLYNDGYYKSRPFNKNRSRFWNDYFSHGAEYSFKKNCKPEKSSLFKRILRKIKHVIKDKKNEPKKII